MQQRNNVTQSSNPTGASISASNERLSYNIASAKLATYNNRQETTANVEQTFHRHLDKTGVIYAEGLPKMDYVSPTIRKQILEAHHHMIVLPHYKQYLVLLEYLQHE